MATRKVKNAKDLSTGELIYFKGHAQATYMSDGTTVEDAIKRGITPGGASAEEIYIGSEEPTDDKYKVWINPDENPEGSTNPGGSGGSIPASNGPLTFYIGYLTTLSAEERITAEQKEHNAAMFEIYKSSPYALGVFVDQSEVFTASNGMSGRAIKTSVPYQAQYFPPETGAEAIMLKQKITDNNEIGVIIFPDGSVYSAHELE